MKSAAMPTTIDIRDLPERLGEVLEAITSGTEVILADGATDRARLVPIPPALRVPGLHPGAMTAGSDFDALPDEFWVGQS